MFNAISYLLSLGSQNALAKEKAFYVGTCSDLHTIEPVMDNFQTEERFFLVIETVDGAMVGGRPGWFNRRVYTVAIISRYEWENQEDRTAQLSTCREIARQLLSRLIADKEDLELQDSPVYLRTDSIQYREMQPYAMAGATGVILTIRIDEPADLSFNEDEWQMD